ncbi:MAG: DUF5615 family PIN-like protein [Burkholderiales bacterium]
MAREKGHDIRDARERSPDPGDEELLAQALAERRVLVTLDKDFGTLVFAMGKPHGGVVRLPDVPAAARIVLFERLLALHEKDARRWRKAKTRARRLRIGRQSDRIDRVA